MCDSIKDGGRRCEEHRKYWEALSEEQQASILTTQEESAKAAQKAQRLSVRLTHEQHSQLRNANVNADEAHQRVLAMPYFSERTLQQELTSSEMAAKLAAEQQARIRGRGGRIPTAGTAAPVKLNVNLTKAEDAAVQLEAAHFALPKAEYARRQIVGEDVRRHPISMGKDTRQVREAWLGIPEAQRRALVGERVSAEQQISDCKERMRELERIIILKRGTDNEEDYKLVGQSMREKALLKLDLEELQERQAAEKTQEREATVRRERNVQRLRTALHVSMSALRLMKSKRHTEAFIVGFGAVVVEAAAHRASRSA